MTKFQNILIVILLVSCICSCAGLAVKSEAQSEFDEGISLFNRGRYDDALKHFEHATELNPEFGKAYLYLGRSYLNMGRWQQSLPPFRTAFRLAPEESKKEITDIIMDFILQNAAKIDEDQAFEIMDSLEVK